MPARSATCRGRWPSGCCSAARSATSSTGCSAPPGPGRGHVVDFIDYFGLFIGNVADIAIVVAAGIIVVLSFRGTALSGPVHHPEHADD